MNPSAEKVCESVLSVTSSGCFDRRRRYLKSVSPQSAKSTPQAAILSVMTSAIGDAPWWNAQSNRLVAVSHTVTVDTSPSHVLFFWHMAVVQRRVANSICSAPSLEMMSVGFIPSNFRQLLLKWAESVNPAMTAASVNVVPRIKRLATLRSRSHTR